MRSNVASGTCEEKKLNGLCPTEDTVGFRGGTPYPLAKLRNFRFIAKPLLIQ
jgi:hypothetical protein